MLETNQSNPARNPEWFTLRVSGRETVEWEKTLGDRGLEVWTPWSWVQKRKPRSKETYWAQVPVLGSYVFLNLKDLPEYWRLPAATLQEVRPMLIQGKFVVMEEKDLDGLREYDKRDLDQAKIQAAMARRARRRRGRLFVQEAQLEEVAAEVGLPTWSWKVGDKVRVMGVLAGMEGTVEEVVGEEVVVAIKIPAARLKVPGFLLQQL